MADYEHLTNLIQGEVIRITERHVPEVQEAELGELVQFLEDQRRSVLIAKIKIATQSDSPPEPRKRTP